MIKKYKLNSVATLTVDMDKVKELDNDAKNLYDSLEKNAATLTARYKEILVTPEMFMTDIGVNDRTIYLSLPVTKKDLEETSNQASLSISAFCA